MQVKTIKLSERELLRVLSYIFERFEIARHVEAGRGKNKSFMYLLNPTKPGIYTTAYLYGLCSDRVNVIRIERSGAVYNLELEEGDI